MLVRCRRAQARGTAEAQRPGCGKGNGGGSATIRGRKGSSFRRAQSSNAKSATSPHHRGTYFDSTIFHIAAARARCAARETQVRSERPTRFARRAFVHSRRRACIATRRSRRRAACGMRFHTKLFVMIQLVAQTRSRSRGRRIGVAEDFAEQRRTYRHGQAYRDARGIAGSRCGLNPAACRAPAPPRRAAAHRTIACTRARTATGFRNRPDARRSPPRPR